ncbi:gamma-glutamylcyclotransferase family protein [Methanobacterium formicicum]|uniref:Gamma-glutamylcyclotransferase n=1 Tax=Methanobacterium formicicum TaxID=2162 RepID=A0A843AQ30_METFO|nr:gamma-glutamylcyclotransferase family protein [Methanobacterium formicicum]MBF4475928.1 gamma-glutamylcyclotransferase [Methanobacterium formicicum]
MLYFAYGSNMKFERISKRIKDVEYVDIGQLLNYKLFCNKKSKDGTAKANIVYNYGDLVWGVLYEIDESHYPKLDLIEGGYERKVFEIQTENGKKILANAYISTKFTDAFPSSSYKDLIVQGAIENNFPDEYIEYLVKLPVSE